MKLETLFRFGMVTAVLLAATGVGVAAVPHAFNKGDVISSSAMNDNFVDLEKKATSARHVATIGTSSYSVGATQGCGATAPSGGDFGKPSDGYGAAKAKCEATCSSPSAHMCTSEEVVRLAQMGKPVAPGWISAGFSAPTVGPTALTNDCYGWTTSVGVTPAPGSTQQFGVSWEGSFVGFRGCNDPRPVVCCD